MCQQDRREAVSGLYEGYMFIYCVDFHIDAKKNGKHSPYGSTNSYLGTKARAESHLIYPRPKATVYVASCSAESSFQAKYSPCAGAKAKGAKANGEVAILPSGAFHSSLQTPDGKTPLYPGTAPAPSGNPNTRGCAAGWTTRLIPALLHAAWRESKTEA